MTKGTINLYVDRDLVEIAKSKNINISELLENALKGAVLTDTETEKSAKEQQKDIDIEIAELSGQITTLKAKKIGLEKQKDIEWRKKYGLTDEAKLTEEIEIDD